MANENRVYLSQRGKPLLYVDPPPGFVVLTAENYDKWYELYVIQPDGTVAAVDVKDLETVMDQHPEALWVDHLYHPRLIYWLAQHLGAEVDERLIEVAIGRWVSESGSRQFPSELFSDPRH